jgi:hypothetical protein
VRISQFLADKARVFENLCSEFQILSVLPRVDMLMNASKMKLCNGAPELGYLNLAIHQSST